MSTANIKVLSLDHAINTVSLDHLASSKVDAANGSLIFNVGTIRWRLPLSSLKIMGPPPPGFKEDDVIFAALVAFWNLGGMGNPEPVDRSFNWNELVNRPRLTGWPPRGSRKDQIKAVLAANRSEIGGATSLFPLKGFLVDLFAVLRDEMDNATPNGCTKVQRVIFETHQALRNGVNMVLISALRREVFSVLSPAATRAEIQKQVREGVFWRGAWTHHPVNAEVQTFQDDPDVDPVLDQALDNALTELLLEWSDVDASEVRALATGYRYLAIQNGAEDLSSAKDFIQRSTSAVLTRNRGFERSNATLVAENDSLKQSLATERANIALLEARVSELEARPAPTVVTPTLGAFIRTQASYFEVWFGKFKEIFTASSEASLATDIKLPWYSRLKGKILGWFGTRAKPPPTTEE